MKNPYARVIDELQKTQNWRSIVFRIAQFAPSNILRAIDEVEKQNEPAFFKECREMVKAGEKIGAIKKWREMTGQGLQESKDAVEAL